jgi:hypothetical protein
MNINNQLGLATHPIPAYKNSVDQQLGFIGSDGQGMMFNADGGEYWASKAQPNTSDDTLLMLNEDSNFLNAGGNDGNWRNDRKYYLGDESSVDFRLDADRIRDKSTGKIITNDLKYVQSKIDQYALEADDLRKRLQGTELNVTTAQWTADSEKNRNRANANQTKWVKDRLVIRLKEILQDLQTAQAKVLEAKAKADSDAKVKADNDAFAKAKTSNTIVAYTQYIKNFPEGLSVDKATKAIDDIKKAQTLKELEEKKKTATPEEKKQIDAEINNILGIDTTPLKGMGGKILLYGGVALVGAFLLYRVLRSNPTSA